MQSYRSYFLDAADMSQDPTDLGKITVGDNHGQSGERHGQRPVMQCE
jgi:hypothetical protein